MISQILSLRFDTAGDCTKLRFFLELICRMMSETDGIELSSAVLKGISKNVQKNSEVRLDTEIAIREARSHDSIFRCLWLDMA
jgi:hypothetical protein